MEEVLAWATPKIELIVMISLGVVAHMLVVARTARKKIPPEVLKFVDYFTMFITSMLTGLLGFYGMSFLNESIELRVAGAGLAAFIGNRALTVISERVIDLAADKLAEKSNESKQPDNHRQPPNDDWMDD